MTYVLTTARALEMATSKLRKYFLPLGKDALLNKKIIEAATSQSIEQGSAQIELRIGLDRDFASLHKETVVNCRSRDRAVITESDYVLDLYNRQDLHNLLEDCDGVIICTDSESPDLLETENKIVDAAQDVGLKKIVKVSCASGILGEKSPVDLGRVHWEVEQKIKQSGISYSFVRPNMLMDTFLQGSMFEMICGRMLSVSVKHGKLSFVDGMDVANAIVKIASGKNEDTNEFTLTGPEALTYQEIADILSSGIGNKVTYSYFPLWAIQPALWIKGVPPNVINNQIQMSRALEAGAQGQVTYTLQDIIGHPLRTFTEFVADRADSWPLVSFQ